nr:hypothetical protein [Nitrosomonas ureae]
MTIDRIVAVSTIQDVRTGAAFYRIVGCITGNGITALPMIAFSNPLKLSPAEFVVPVAMLNT